MLVALRKRLKIAKDTGAYSLYGEDNVTYYFYDRDLIMWFDSTRKEILKILSSICEEKGKKGTTDKNGELTFFGLTQGVYLFVQTEKTQLNNNVYQSEPFDSNLWLCIAGGSLLLFMLLKRYDEK